jgi:hypothetical protein
MLTSGDFNGDGKRDLAAGDIFSVLVSAGPVFITDTWLSVDLL